MNRPGEEAKGLKQAQLDPKELINPNGVDRSGQYRQVRNVVPASAQDFLKTPENRPWTMTNSPPAIITPGSYFNVGGMF
jgi:hypothetical protein